jgi:SAM-dependent methyltransferase
LHLNSELMFEKYVWPALAGCGTVLELGPADVPSRFAATIADPTAWHAADIAATTIKGSYTIPVVMPDEYTIPVEDESYDAVFSANVLEHVRKPWVWIREVVRVVRPGGVVATIIPASWPYHEAPVDCWRAYPEGLRALYEDAGLTVEVAACEALEQPRTPNPYAGSGRKTAAPETDVKARIKRLLHWPMPRAFDTAAVGRKQ